MAFGFFRIFKGLNIVPKSGSTANSLGDIEVDSGTNKANFHNGSSTSPVVTEAHSATLTNKTMDANSNSFSNFHHGIEVDNPSSNVHGVTGNVVGTSDSQVLTNKTIDGNNNTISNLLHGVQVNNPSSGVHGVTGTIVGTSDSQILTNKTIDAANNTISNISNTEIKSGANIARNKLASGSANQVIINDGSGVLTSEAQLNITRGGTGQSTASAAFNALSPTTAKGDLIVRTLTSNVNQSVGSDGQILTADSTQTNGIKWSTPTSAPDQSYELSNLALTASVLSNNLTINLKNKALNNPSVGDSVKIGFRDSIASTGDYIQRLVTTSTSIIINSGSTLGFSSSQPEYLYIYALDNSGTVELVVIGGAPVVDEGTLSSTTAEGSGTATSRYTLYSTTARTSKAIRLIGRLKFTLTTAGIWDSGPNEISLFPFSQRVASRHEVIGDTPRSGSAGHGTTNTAIRRWTNSSTIGTALSYTDSATNGMSITCNLEGLYAISYCDTRSSGAVGAGWSLNSNQLNMNISGITTANRLILAVGAANDNPVAATVVRMKPGDILRTHDNAASDGTSAFQQFRIAYIGN